MGRQKKENLYFKKLSGQMQRSKPIYFSLQIKRCVKESEWKGWSHAKVSTEEYVNNTVIIWIFQVITGSCQRNQRVKNFSERGFLLKNREDGVFCWEKK